MTPLDWLEERLKQAEENLDTCSDEISILKQLIKYQTDVRYIYEEGYKAATYNINVGIDSWLRDPNTKACLMEHIEESSLWKKGVGNVSNNS